MGIHHAAWTLKRLLSWMPMVVFMLTSPVAALASALSDYAFEPDAAYKYRQVSNSATSTYEVYNLGFEREERRWAIFGAGVS